MSQLCNEYCTPNRFNHTGWYLCRIITFFAFYGCKHKELPIQTHILLSFSDSFTSQVWMMLKDKVSFGQTVSYGQLAAMCGNMRASRAVGMAMRNNPLSLIIPCHRVIQSGGQIGNYHGGKKNLVKVWLLKHEGAIKWKLCSDHFQMWC